MPANQFNSARYGQPVILRLHTVILSLSKDTLSLHTVILSLSKDNPQHAIHIVQVNGPFLNTRITVQQRFYTLPVGLCFNVGFKNQDLV